MLWKRNVKSVKGCPSCLPSSTTAWDSGVRQLLCHGVTVRSRPPGSYDQGGIGGPSSDFAVGRWQDLSLNPLRILRTFQGGAPANLLSFTEALIASFASLWQVSNVEDLSHPAKLENGRRWRVSCYLCKNALTFVPDDVEWKMCIISNPWQTILHVYIHGLYKVCWCVHDQFFQPHPEISKPPCFWACYLYFTIWKYIHHTAYVEILILIFEHRNQKSTYFDMVFHNTITLQPSQIGHAFIYAA